MELYNIFNKYPVISTDSRNVAQNSIFFALKGDSFDGNKFAISALEKGAGFAVVDDLDRVVEGASVELYEKYKHSILVTDDALMELQKLAATHRAVLGIPILAITGSNGKTTTKELLARVLSCQYNISTTKGNLNNHIGVPLTILSMTRATEFGVVEMGASGCGEVELLCAITRPNFGLITNIGRAHLDGFKGLDGVKKGKGELYDSLMKDDGVAFVLTDSEDLVEMAKLRDGLDVVPYSKDLARGVKSNLEGVYNDYNIAAAIVIGEYFGVEEQYIHDAIGSYVPDNNRSQRKQTQSNSLIIDCYNANPSSVKAALDNLYSIVGSVRSKCVILGDMLELGEYTAIEHRSIIEQLKRNGVEDAYFVGCNFFELSQENETQDGYKFFVNRSDLVTYLQNTPIKESLILIKGSNSIGLDKIVELL